MQEVTDLAQQASADIVIFGHSHKYSVNQQHGTLYVNPGSAGPARFRLKRTVALLHLPSKVWPSIWALLAAHALHEPQYAARDFLILDYVSVKCRRITAQQKDARH